MKIRLNKEIKLSNIDVVGDFCGFSNLEINDSMISNFDKGAVYIKVQSTKPNEKLKNINLIIGFGVTGFYNVIVSGHDSIIKVGNECKGRFAINTWRKSYVSIGNKTTSNDTRIICDNSYFECGEDCMFSDGVLIQTADQHGIVDLSSNSIINDAYNKTVLGKHVWLGRESTVMPNVEIHEGSVIGARAIVTSTVSPCSIAVGAPARVVKNGVTWSRSPVNVDLDTRKYIEQMEAKY